MPDAGRGQKRVSVPLQLQFCMVVSHHVEARKQTWARCKSNRYFQQPTQLSSPEALFILKKQNKRRLSLVF